MGRGHRLIHPGCTRRLTRLSRVDKALIVMGDQPSVPVDVVDQLIDSHARSDHPVSLPKYRYSWATRAGRPPCGRASCLSRAMREHSVSGRRTPNGSTSVVLRPRSPAMSTPRPTSSNCGPSTPVPPDFICLESRRLVSFALKGHMARIDQVAGIAHKDATKLRKAGVRTSKALIEIAGERKGRADLAAATGIDRGISNSG